MIGGPHDRDDRECVTSAMPSLDFSWWSLLPAVCKIQHKPSHGECG